MDFGNDEDNGNMGDRYGEEDRLEIGWESYRNSVCNFKTARRPFTGPLIVVNSKLPRPSCLMGEF